MTAHPYQMKGLTYFFLGKKVFYSILVDVDEVKKYPCKT